MARPDDNDALYPDDEARDPWCRDFAGHTAAHEFCEDHQVCWCRWCDQQCPDCTHDPRCPGCHRSVDEYCDWDCPYAEDDA